MTFDVFGDFATRGYLRNTASLQDPRAVREFEHRAFLSNLDEAIAYLATADSLTYEHICGTHRILFQDVYPWAGQDRLALAPNIAISRGGRDDLFAHPEDIRAAADYALRLGQDTFHMRRYPGEVFGYLAHAHPFLDGNGRSIMVAHSEMAYRAGIGIEWHQTDKASFLDALTRELDRPGKGELDGYLEPFVGGPIDHPQASAMLAKLTGFGSSGSRRPEQESPATSHIDHEQDRHRDAVQDYIRGVLSAAESDGSKGQDQEPLVPPRDPSRGRDR